MTNSIQKLNPQLSQRSRSPGEELDGEPGVADTLHEEEGRVRVGAVLVQGPGGAVDGGPDGEVVDDRDPHVRVSFETESQNRNTNEEDGDYSHTLHS